MKAIEMVPDQRLHGNLYVTYTIATLLKVDATNAKSFYLLGGFGCAYDKNQRQKKLMSLQFD